MTVPTAQGDLQPPGRRPKWRLRVVQTLSIAVPGALTVFMPALGTPLLVATGVILIWVERNRE